MLWEPSRPDDAPNQASACPIAAVLNRRRRDPHVDLRRAPNRSRPSTRTSPNPIASIRRAPSRRRSRPSNKFIDDNEPTGRGSGDRSSQRVAARSPGPPTTSGRRLTKVRRAEGVNPEHRGLGARQLLARERPAPRRDRARPRRSGSSRTSAAGTARRAHEPLIDTSPCTPTRGAGHRSPDKRPDRWPNVGMCQLDRDKAGAPRCLPRDGPADVLAGERQLSAGRRRRRAARQLLDEVGSETGTRGRRRLQRVARRYRRSTRRRRRATTSRSPRAPAIRRSTRSTSSASSTSPTAAGSRAASCRERRSKASYERGARAAIGRAARARGCTGRSRPLDRARSSSSARRAARSAPHAERRDVRDRRAMPITHGRDAGDGAAARDTRSKDLGRRGQERGRRSAAPRELRTGWCGRARSSTGRYVHALRARLGEDPRRTTRVRMKRAGVLRRESVWARRTPLVAVISDTHLPRGSRGLPEEVRRALPRGRPDPARRRSRVGVLPRELEALGPPVAAVHGNADEPALRASCCRRERVVEGGGARIGMVHDGGPAGGRGRRGSRRASRAATPSSTGTRTCRRSRRGDGVWILNPGSPTERRRAPSARCSSPCRGGGVVPESLPLALTRTSVRSLSVRTHVRRRCSYIVLRRRARLERASPGHQRCAWAEAGLPGEAVRHALGRSRRRSYGGDPRAGIWKTRTGESPCRRRRSSCRAERLRVPG